MLSELPNPIIIAHRGARAYAPENTLAAFDLAINQGADALELDVRLSSDDKIIVIHDSSIERTTDGIGLVNNFSVHRLKEYDAGCFFDIKFKNERIPTLNEVFAEFGRRIFIIIEIKSIISNREHLIGEIVELIKFHNMVDSVLISSFDPIILARIKTIYPEITISLLSKNIFVTLWPFSPLLPVYAYQLPMKLISTTLLKRLQSSGRRVYSFTVNKQEDMTRLFRLGINGIFTDDPLLARQILTNI